MSKPLIEGVDKICEIITQQGHGYFCLYDAFKTEKYGNWPVSGEGTESKKVSPEDLCNALQSLIDKLGESTYTIELKANSKANSLSTDTYRFKVKPAQSNQTETKASFNGLYGVDDLKATLGKFSEVEQLVYEQRIKLQQLDFEIEKRKLQQQIDDLKAKKEGGNNEKLGLANLAGLGTVVAIGIISKVAPEAMPLIQDALNAINVPQPDENENQTQY